MKSHPWLQSLRRRRAARQQAGRQRGMTLLEILIVLAILGLVMGLLIGPRLIGMFSEGQEKVAQTEAKKYAFEAFTRWTMSNPGQACPEDLSALNKYLDKKESLDPWGNEYVMHCGAQSDELPSGTRFGVQSPGADGKMNTDDDVRSWE